ncbi:MAG: AmmeMemoRadiSam system protein A [Pseudomonadota bacterium]|nr:AmmeMemoRadiSam system protein A [Pseudomonadota bacterium]
MNSHTPEQGRLLTALARNAIAHEFGEPAADLPHPDWLDEPGAVFVTLTQKGEGGQSELRGCIGSLEAHRALIDDLQANARAAAFKDPRFPPMSRDELPGTRVEVSILSSAEPMRFTSEADALAQLRPGIDGVIFEHGWHRATFLPQVWEQLPEARQFMANLKRKAGLAADFWADDLRLSRYQVEKFKEKER